MRHITCKTPLDIQSASSDNNCKIQSLKTACKIHKMMPIFMTMMSIKIDDIEIFFIREQMGGTVS